MMRKVEVLLVLLLLAHDHVDRAHYRAHDLLHPLLRGLQLAVEVAHHRRLVGGVHVVARVGVHVDEELVRVVVCVDAGLRRRVAGVGVLVLRFRRLLVLLVLHPPHVLPDQSRLSRRRCVKAVLSR